VLAVMLSGCVRERTPQHYLVPDGFSGWVYVRYDDPTCPPLEMRDRRQVITFPKSGKVCTSTTHETGVATDLWEYVQADGTRRPLSESERPSQGAFHEPGHFESNRIGGIGLSTGPFDPFPSFH
jgi:hypothetical protein